MSIRGWVRRWLEIDRDIAKVREDLPRAVEATVVRVKPGDVLILRTDESLSLEQADRIKRRWEADTARLGFRVPVIVLSGLHLQILRQHARGARRGRHFATGGVVEPRNYLVGETAQDAADGLTALAVSAMMAGVRGKGQ
jgi:hypothetical protein